MAVATGWASRVTVAVGWATAVAGWEAAAVETADLEEEDGEAEDGGRTEVARAELEQKQRRRKLRAGMEWPVRARGLAWQGWHGLGLPPIGIAGLARARELGTAGLGGPGHAYLPRLAAKLGEHVRGQQESRGAGWRLGRRVTQERLGEWLHEVRRGGPAARRDAVGKTVVPAEYAQVWGGAECRRTSNVKKHRQTDSSRQQQNV